MPFVAHTPESLLPRSDSKIAANTCKGITATGRHCRKSISRSPGRVSGTRTHDGFCHMHQDQAQTATPPRLPPTIKERTSIDTLAERLGLLDVELRQRRKPVRKPEARPAKRPQPKSNLRLLCCIGEADEAKRAPRPAKKPDRPTSTSIPPKPSRPPMGRDRSSRTGEFLALIPSYTPPETTALLLAELAKPVSVHDEHGYIYMFLMTPESLPSGPPKEVARDLLAPPTRHPGGRRTSDVLSSFSAIPASSNKDTILLKIGRTKNVQQRMNQWSRQCGYNVAVIRTYPYYSTTLSSTSVNKPPRTPRMVPNMHKVERLIHIELNGMKAASAGKCGACGREHREWFEVGANRRAVEAMDEVIRRWVEWGERTTVR